MAKPDATYPALVSGDKWTDYLVFANASQCLLVAFVRPTGRVKLRPIHLPRVLVNLVIDRFPEKGHLHKAFRDYR
jgi:hypothetical protein